MTIRSDQRIRASYPDHRQGCQADGCQCESTEGESVRELVIAKLEDAHTILDCSAQIDRDEATRVYNAVRDALAYVKQEG